MSMTLSLDKLVTIIRAFSHEISSAVKIGMDVGENVVVQYAYDKSSQIDLLGYI